MTNTQVETLRICLVEDDKWYAQILEHHLTLNPDYTVQINCTARQCLDQEGEHPHVICMDYHLPDMEGKELLRQLAKKYPKVPVIVISGQEDVGLAIELLKEPAVVDYIVKDDATRDKLWRALLNLNCSETPSLFAQPNPAPKGCTDFSKVLIGQSEAMCGVYDLMQKAIDNEITVSITGPTGTGKELVAKSIHDFSPRKKQAFVAVNMSAIPADLAESELFGHEKGAFTGADHRRIGKFEEAHGGTIFLDEIAELAPALQSKLLRVLQEPEVVRVGGNKRIPINVRIIVATHKNLETEVRQGRFRQDLYFRILGLQLNLPSLRERHEDIMPLANHFVQSFCTQNNKTPKPFSRSAVSKLQSYAYPGNVRELKAVVELSMVLAEGAQIDATHLMLNDSHVVEELLEEEHTLKGYMSRIIRHYLNRYDHNIGLVARKLDMGKSTLYRMVKDQEV